ncbi:MAG: hypothetical protein Q9220_002423 [cf. Caloplaca sp. 1 TL-2023]
MFKSEMLGKRKVSKFIAPVKKRRKGEPVLEEITFDFNDREDYLTGFHKRKLQRIKHAKEEALVKERQEKIADRKALREGRKTDLEKHVEAVNAAVRDAENAIGISEWSDHGEREELWNGIEEPANVDHEDDYLDEDRHTIVTVEAVNVSRDGLQKTQDGAEEETVASTQIDEREVSAGNPKQKEPKGRRAVTKRTTSEQPKRKKKFRYESKAERKMTRAKQKMGSSAKAKARRG